jgi:hypothetical protein
LLSAPASIRKAHQRIILVATMALILAAMVGLPFAVVHRKPPMDYLASYTFLLLLVAYDLWSMRKMHRATLGAGAFLVFSTRSAVRLQKPRLGTRLPDRCRHWPVDEAQMAKRNHLSHRWQNIALSTQLATGEITDTVKELTYPRYTQRPDRECKCDCAPPETVIWPC